jgi:tripartite-type tricarboxylate transporter receptor subunit TctC
MVSRTLGAKLTERLGQPVIVESVTHGIGIQGNSMVSRSAPDGHTFAMLTGGFTTQAAVVKTLPYHPVRDFAFVSTVVAYPMFISVAPGSPITSFKDLTGRGPSPGRSTTRSSAAAASIICSANGSRTAPTSAWSRCLTAARSRPSPT